MTSQISDDKLNSECYPKKPNLPQQLQQHSNMIMKTHYQASCLFYFEDIDLLQTPNFFRCEHKCFFTSNPKQT
jgi:hypothetical protein